MQRRVQLWVAALVGLFVALCARGHVFASHADEAVFVLLARSLRAGRYAAAGGLGHPVADHLPGFPALLALPSAVLEGHWAWYWPLGLLSTAAFVVGAWRLAKRHTGSDAAAGAVAGLCALAPATLELSGAALSDVPFAALVAWVFSGLARAPLGLLCAAVAAGALMRPQGVALVAGAAVGGWLTRGRRAGVLLAASGAIPLAAWAARSKFVVGAASDYFPQWTLQKAPSPVELFGALFGGAPFGATGVAALAGAAALTVAAVLGARALRRGPRRAELAGMATFVGATLMMHASWGSVTARYGLPLLPFVWLCAVEAVRARSAPRVAAAAWATMGVFLVSASWPRARAGFMDPTYAHAQAMRWLAERTPADARVESVSCSVVRLLAQRDTTCPILAEERDAWLGSLARGGVGYVHDFDFESDGYLPGTVEEFVERRRVWLARWPGFRQAFVDTESGAVVYALETSELRRLSAAYERLDAALTLAAGGDTKAIPRVRAALEASVRLAPELAVARAALAELETDRARRIKAFERALARDPESRVIAARLADAKAPSKR